MDSIDKVLKTRKLSFFLRLIQNKCTRDLIKFQFERMQFHEFGFVKNLCEIYLNFDLNPSTNWLELYKRVQQEKDSSDSNRNNQYNTEEDEAIRYLLKNRSKLNNQIINNLLRYSIFS